MFNRQDGGPGVLVKRQIEREEGDEASSVGDAVSDLLIVIAEQADDISAIGRDLEYAIGQLRVALQGLPEEAGGRFYR